MKTKTLLQTTGLTILLMVLTTLFANAQIPFQGLATDHEGTACWDADGTGPEPEAYAHTDPFGWGSTRFYGSSRDYDGIDPDPNAALCHLLDNITGFPLFVQALTDNGFAPGQVKIKTSANNLKDDEEGADWFLFNNVHYVNRYDSYYIIELNGEPMVSAYINQFFVSNVSGSSSWNLTGNFSRPWDASGSGSTAVKEVAAAFLADLAGQELRMVIDDLQTTGESFSGCGRLNGAFHEIISGYLEKGMPELPFTGIAADHEGIAGWDADGTGPEPAGTGHTFTYNGVTWWMAYYTASRDYDDIDPDPNAASSHFTGIGIGFPNLEIQLAYRGFTIDQFKIKTGLGSLGDDIEDKDWGLNGSLHWYNHYGNLVTLEIAGEPILEYVIDTNFSFNDVALPNNDWWSYTTCSSIRNISSIASMNAQKVALSFLKDLAGHSMKTYMEGHHVGGVINTNGRDGTFHEISAGKLIPELPAGTLVWENEASGAWDLAGSPYIVMGYLKIPDGEMLTIEEGVVVKFNTTEWFDIQGCLKALGTEQAPILFTAYDNSVRWGGMAWDQTPVTNETSELKHCILEYAYAYNYINLPGYNSGGAIVVNDYDNIEISHCLFRYNLANKPGAPGETGPAGGAIGLNESSIHISHCIFHDNQAGHGGAIALANHSNPIIDNSLFFNNQAIDWYGGVLLTYISCSPYFINCTFADNYALNGGGAIELEHGGVATFTNCIFWGNTAGSGPGQISIWDIDSCFLNIYYCDVEDGLNGIEPGFEGEYIENIDENPEFNEFAGTGNFPFTLKPSSPCIDMGTLDTLYFPQGWVCPECCLCGQPRVSGSCIDMGCFEMLITGTDKPIVSKEMTLRIYPNPAGTATTIEFYHDGNTDATISVLDMEGKTVAVLPVSGIQKGLARISLNTGELPAGVYFCRLQSGNKMVSRKFIRTK
ncbi:MAG: T9SS type A sorting domain-containing protein [Bacteroidales bacterium]|nr:T9SS type A sorting domain-containing protein [Bacteroidales bacterium]